MESSRLPGLLTMTGLCLLNLIGGLANIYGNLVVYIASYLHLYSPIANLSNLSMAFPIQGASWGLGLITGAIFYSYCGGRMIIGIGVGSIAACFVVCSFLTEFYPFLIVFMFMCGFGPCTIVINSLWVAWAWFPKRRGLVTGFVMMFYGAGSSVLNIVFTFLMNPNNEYPEKPVEVGNQTEYLFGPNIANRLPRTLRIFALICLFLAVFCLLLISDKPQTREERKSIEKSVVSRQSAIETPHCPSLQIAIRTSAFWMLFLYSFLSYAFVLFMLIQYKNYALTEYKNDQLISGIGSIAFVCNTVTRFLISVLMDYIPFKKVSIVVMATQTVLSLTITWIVSMPYVYMIWVSLTLVCFAAVFSPVTIACGDIFGPEIGAKVFSIISNGSILCNFSLTALVEYVVKPYGYPLAFHILTGVAFAGGVVVVLLKTQYKWTQESLLSEGK